MVGPHFGFGRDIDSSYRSWLTWPPEMECSENPAIILGGGRRKSVSRNFWSGIFGAGIVGVYASSCLTAENKQALWYAEFSEQRRAGPFNANQDPDLDFQMKVAEWRHEDDPSQFSTTGTIKK